jgi:hypothetical protein
MSWQMTTPPKKQFGGLPPQYNFVLNPYPEVRVSRCPFCDRKTGQRKVPLFIHVDPLHPIALNYTCRYCSHCDLLIGHKHKLEHLLTQMFAPYHSAVIGNDYLIMGTVDKKAWRESMAHPKSIPEMLPYVSRFKTSYQELRLTQPGWYPEGKEPPVQEPPPSTEWVKKGRR